MTNFCLIGIPGAGKSYFATQRLVKWLKKWYLAEIKNKPVLKYPMSNFPVNHEKYGAPIRWTPELMYYPLQDCYIIVDEAYQYFGQNVKKNYKLDYEVFFGTVRHNNIDIVNIAHGMTRINPDIRVKSEIFYVIEKVLRPLSSTPLLFKLTGYYDMNFTNIKSIQPISHEIIFFKPSIAKCYDTHYMKKHPFDMNLLPRWNEEEVNKPNLQDITEWKDSPVGYKNSDIPNSIAEETIRKMKYDNPLDASFNSKISIKEVNRRAQSGEICFWNDEIKEIKDLKILKKD